MLDPNTAPPGALAALPGVGPALLDRLLDARSRRPFRSLEDIRRRVKGVGPKTLDRLRPYLRIEPIRAPGDRAPALAPAP